MRVALRSCVDRGAEIAREPVTGKDNVQVILNIVLAEEFDRDFPTQLASLQFQLYLEEWMLFAQHRRGTVSADDHYRHQVAATSDIGEKINGEDVCPMEVVPKNDQRPVTRQLAEKIREFAFPLLLGDRRVRRAYKRGIRRYVGRRDLQVPAWRNLLKQLGCRLVLEQPIHGFQDWQVGFRSRQALGTAPAHHAEGNSLAQKFGNEILDERSLANAGFTGHA